jgi:hypothetical protein
MASRFKKLGGKVSLSPSGGSGDAGGRENSTGYAAMFRRPVEAFDSFRSPPPPPAIPQPPTMHSTPSPASPPLAQQGYYGAIATNIPPATTAPTPPLSSGCHSPDGSSAASINPYESAVTNLNGTPHPLTDTAFRVSVTAPAINAGWQGEQHQSKPAEKLETTRHESRPGQAAADPRLAGCHRSCGAGLEAQTAQVAP